MARGPLNTAIGVLFGAVLVSELLGGRDDDAPLADWSEAYARHLRALADAGQLPGVRVPARAGPPYPVRTY